jgi:putative Holliday junction resolvase
MTLLGFDFGLKRIGVAIGQLVTETARPLITLNAKNGDPDWNEITKLIEKWRPDALVIGLPLNMDGTTQHITHKAQAFATSLRERYAITTHEVDERLTTKEAREYIFSQGGYKALQSGVVDQVAAQLILQNFIADFKKK